jgi:ankyrin repeat protein
VLLLAGRLSAAAPDRRLVEAVKQQDVKAVQKLLRQGVDVNTPEGDGATALHWAAHWDDRGTADLLVRAGANVNAANDYGVTPLGLACTSGSLPLVERLLTAGANPNAVQSNGETPLMTGARAGHEDVVRRLLKSGADVNAAERLWQHTPLMLAAAEGHAGVVRALIEGGADVEARSAVRGPKAATYGRDMVRRTGGVTPLLLAARQGEVETSRLLLSAGANVNAAAADGTTALLVASIRGHVSLAMFLLEHGADPNADGAGYAALHWAAGSWETELTGVNGIATERDAEWAGLAGVRTSKLEFVKALLAHGANPNARLVKEPPLVGHSVRGTGERCGLQTDISPVGACAQRLIEATPFVLAASAGDASVMRVLMASGADPRLVTKDGTTPLMMAAGLDRWLAESRVTESRALEAVRVALAFGADVNAANAIGQTALHAAGFNDAVSIAQELVDHGAKINVKNKRGETPLMIAETALVSLNMVGINYRTRTGDLLRKLGAETAVGDQTLR